MLLTDAQATKLTAAAANLRDGHMNPDVMEAIAIMMEAVVAQPLRLRDDGSPSSGSSS